MALGILDANERQSLAKMLVLKEKPGLAAGFPETDAIMSFDQYLATTGAAPQPNL